MQVLEQQQQQEVKEDNEAAVNEAETENKKLKKEQRRKEKAKIQRVLKRVNSTPYITEVNVIDSYSDGHGQDTCHVCDGGSWYNRDDNKLLPMIQLKLMNKKDYVISICHDCLKNMNKMLLYKQGMRDTNRKIKSKLGVRQGNWNKECEVWLNQEERNVLLEDSVLDTS